MDGNDVVQATNDVIQQHHVEAAVCQKSHRERVDAVRLPMVKWVCQSFDIEPVSPFYAFMVFPWC